MFLLLSIGGGVTKSATTTSEFFNIEAEVFRPGPELPGEFSSHCSAAIDGNRAALIGGFVNINFIYDFAADSFTELPPLNTARRGTFCGIADSGRGQEIVVAGSKWS